MPFKTVYRGVRFLYWEVESAEKFVYFKRVMKVRYDRNNVII